MKTSGSIMRTAKKKMVKERKRKRKRRRKKRKKKKKILCQKRSNRPTKTKELPGSWRGS
jgi:hypothetical protein